MTPDLPPVLPPAPDGYAILPETFEIPEGGFVGYKVHLSEFSATNVWTGPKRWHGIEQNNSCRYAAAIGSPIARANGIGGEPTSDPCESESPKSDNMSGNNTPLTDNYFSTKTNLTDAKSFCYHLELRLSSSESDLAAAREEHSHLTSDVYEALRFLGMTTVEKLGGRSLKDIVSAEIQRLRAALEFYADVSKYPAPKTGGLGELYFDCGETARKALAPASSGKGEG